MKNRKIISSLIGLSMAALPMAAMADTGTSVQGGFFIHGNGMVHAIRAEVTAISGTVINAISRFGSHVINWSVTTSADTQFSGAATSSASIKVGDKINVAGTLTGIGSTISVNATKVREAGDKVMRRIFSGTVASINAAAGSFVLTTKHGATTVQTDSATKISVNGTASALSSLFVGEKVVVKGSQTSTTSVVTASQVSARTSDDEKNDKDDKKGRRGSLLKAFLGLHIGGHGKDD